MIGKNVSTLNYWNSQLIFNANQHLCLRLNKSGDYDIELNLFSNFNDY